MYEESGIETTEEEKEHGLKRVKRLWRPEPGETTVENCWVETTISLNPDVLEFFESDSKKINAVLRSAMSHEKIVRELLDDEEFISGIKEKLAA